MSSDEQVLDIGKNVSKFYSLWETRNEEIRDSILARGGTYQEVQNVLGKAGYPRSYEYYAVYKNYPEKGRITYTDKEFKDYMYQEELEKPQWQIFTEEKALVADYQCQKHKLTSGEEHGLYGSLWIYLLEMVLGNSVPYLD